MLYAGLDAGGSKTKLMARSPGQEDLVLLGPGANLQTAGVQKASEVFAALVREALSARPALALSGLCAGVAGAGRPGDAERLAEAWRRALGEDAPERLLVVSDAEIALEAAFEGGSGAIVIIGTGSIVFARAMDRALHRAGGWGPALGDEGGGYAIGLSGLRAVAQAMDGGPATALQRLMAEDHDIETNEHLINRVYREKMRVQDVARTVLAAAAEGDAVARDVLRDQAERLARQVSWLAARCPDVEQRLAFIGGLSQDPFYRELLQQAIRQHLPEWPVLEPAHEPVLGALRLAMAGRNG